MLRVLVFAVIAAVVAVSAGLPARSSTGRTPPGYVFADVDRFVALQRDARWVEAQDEFAGARVEILFTPSATVEVNGRVVLRDALANLTCAAPRDTLSRVARPGDDFLVVRGVLGAVVPGRSTEVLGCEVVSFDGLAWEEAQRSEHNRRLQKYRAGLL